MIKNYLVIVPFVLPWDWSADYQRQTCRLLAKENLVIAYMHQDATFFLKPHRADYPREENIIFFSPRYLVPFRRILWIERVNEFLCMWYLVWRYGRNKRRILWIFDHVFCFFPILVRRFITLSLYDCVDYVWHREKTKRHKIQQNEETLIKAVDIFVVNSHVLAQIHKKQRAPTAVVPQGFRLEDFLHSRATHTIFPKDKPIIGFVGAIDHRIDFPLLLKLARSNRKWRFVLWGPVQEIDESEASVCRHLALLSSLPNVSVGHSNDRKDIPNIIQQFSVAMIPYKENLLSVRYSYPMKLFEYFYMGKPVISTPIEELKRFPKYVKIGKTVHEWEQCVRVLCSQSWSDKNKTEQQKLARENTWEEKIEAISNCLSI